MTTPNPANVAPWYLRNINQALALDESTGNVYMRTGITGDIIIAGNVNIPGNVDAHIVEFGNISIAGDSLPISGNVNVLTMPEVEIKNDSGNPIPISRTTSVNSQTNPLYVEGVNNASFFAPTQSDAFGRLRVSNPYTLFDSKTRYYDHGQFSNTTSGTANVTYDASSSTYDLNVDGASGSKVYNQSFLNFQYQPGKSLLILETFSMNAKKTGLRQRVGYFTWQNGIYFQMAGTATNGTDKAFVIRSNSSGSVVENIVYQANWNGDKLDGTGASGITLDPTLDQILWMDIEWLGVGSVRCGFVINGQFIVCHTFNHANTANIVGETDNTTTYMTTASLPLRYEIENTGATGSSSRLRQICQSVMSEGGFNETVRTETAGTGLSDITLATGNVYYPLVSIRLAAGRTEAIVVPTQIDIMGVGEAYFRWALVRNATLTGATWGNTSSTGTVQIDFGAQGNAISGGTELQSGFAFSRSTEMLIDGDLFKGQLGRTIGNVSDTITLAVSSSQNSKQLFGQLGWGEIT